VPQKALDDDRVMSLVERALAAPADQRRACVETSCAGDTELLDEVWDYVQWELRMGGFLSDPLLRLIPPSFEFEPGRLLENRFRVVRRVAQGGMGVVYEAHDEKLERTIALKCARPGFHNRLPPEVRLASEISHPNVCKIFEIHTASTPEGEFDFLTMEFLDGGSLADRLRAGPLPPHEARAVAQQLCAGLAEAHHRKVIHGDLKSGNVIVTTDPGGGVRAVITDFGLAHWQETAERIAHASEVGGTPGYMAPELLNGGRPNVASDIYALGVMLKEIGYGPARVVRRCVDLNPARRYPSAEGVARALAPRTRRRVLAALAAVVLVAVSGAVTYRTATAPKQSVRLAVMPWEASPGLAGVAQTLTRDTAAVVSRIVGNRDTRFTAVRSGASGATHVLHGKLQPDNGRLRLDACVADARSHDDVKCRSGLYEPGEMKYAPTALGGLVTETFRLPALPAKVNAAAQQDYAAGLAFLRRNSTVDKGLPLLERAVAEDPGSPLTHSGLADAQWWKYKISHERVWLDRARESVRQASVRNADLAEVHRIAGFIQTEVGTYEEAVMECQRAKELDLASGEAYFRLAVAYQKGERFDEALAAYRKAVELDPGNYRVLNALGSLFSERANYADAVQYLTKAVEFAPEEPGAHFALGRTYLYLGRLTEAERALRRSLELGETGEALDTLGIALIYQERNEEAITFISRALRRSSGKFLWWINLGDAFRHLSRGAKAKDAYRRGLALAEEDMLRNAKNGYVRACVAYVCVWLNQRRRAELEIAQALQLSPQNSDARWMAVQTYEALGRRDDALALLSGSRTGLLADVNRDPDLAGLRADPRFKQMMTSIR